MEASKQYEPAVTISKRLILINAASSLVSRLLNVSVLLWMYEYLLSSISTEEFAIYPVVAAVITFAPLFSSLLTGGISRYTIEAYARGDTQRVTETLSSIFPLVLVGGLTFLGLGGIFAWHIDTMLTIPAGRIWDARIMMGLLVIGFALQTIVLPYGVAFYVKQRFVLLNTINVSRDLLRIAILFTLLLGIGPRVLWVVVATVVTNVASLMVITWLSYHMMPQLRFEASLFKWQTARQLMAFGMWTTVGQLAVMINTSAGTILLNKLGTAVDVTNYYVGSMFDRQISAMVGITSGTIQPALTAMHAMGDRQRLGNTYLRGGRYALWITLLAGGPLMVYSTEFIRLYVGHTYLQAGAVMLLLALAYPFTYADIMLTKLAVATARIRPFFIGAITTQIISLALMIYLVGWCQVGAIGVTLAIFITYVAAHTTYFWPLGLRMAEVPFKRFFYETLLPGLMPSVVALTVWLALKTYQPPSTWFQLLVYTLSGHVVYGFVLYRYSLQDHDMADFAQVFRKMTVLAR